MDSGYIVLAVPFFLLLIGVELLVNRARGQHWYRLHDSIASMSCGLGQQTLGLFTTALGLWGPSGCQREAGSGRAVPPSRR